MATKDDFVKAIEELRKTNDKYPTYFLFGTHDVISQVKDDVPSNVKCIELPDNYFPKESAAFLVPRAEIENFGRWGL